MKSTNRQEVKEAIQVAETIIRVQGNLFIKELLRRKKRTEREIRIGTTKEALLDNLTEAIRSGYITREDLDAWTLEVEGWGRQHVYLYAITADLAVESFWHSEDAFQRRLRGATALHVTRSRRTDLDFPEKLRISSVGYHGGTFEAIWRKRYEQWNREKAKDEVRRINGDIYEFRAFRQELSRAVTRFVIKPAERRAALFVQIPLSDPEHNRARDVVKNALSELVAWDKLKPVNLSNAIKSIDRADLDSARVGDESQIVAQSTKFAADGASVDFEADPGNPRWKSNAAVRRVRAALEERDFSGDRATFQIQLRAADGLNRDVLMSVHAKDRRVYLFSQMTAEEVWIALNAIISSSS